MPQGLGCCAFVDRIVKQHDLIVSAFGRSLQNRIC